MNSNYVYLMFSLCFLTLIFSCNRENNQKIEGSITYQSDCKSFKSSLTFDQEDDESCIEYDYDAKSKILILKHINTGFNCCPEEITTEVKLIENTIQVFENEKEALCGCNCLFDIEIEITGIDSDIYYLKIIEPYCGDQEKLEFEIDLRESGSGSYCVERTKYPWGVH